MVQSHVEANVRAEMARHGKNQTDIAELLDTSRESVRRRLRGHVSFRIDELQKIAVYLGVPVADLIGETAVAS